MPPALKPIHLTREVIKKTYFEDLRIALQYFKLVLKNTLSVRSSLGFHASIIFFLLFESAAGASLSLHFDSLGIVQLPPPPGKILDSHDVTSLISLSS